MASGNSNYQVSEYRLAKEIITRGGDVLSAESIEPMRTSIQHGTTSVFEHCVSVAKHSLLIAFFLEKRFGADIDLDSLIRGALLHDYFLYDWHDKEVPGRRILGFTHPRTGERIFLEAPLPEDMTALIEKWRSYVTTANR